MTINFSNVARGIFSQSGTTNDLKVPPGSTIFPFTTCACAMKLSEIKSTP